MKKSALKRGSRTRRKARFKQKHIKAMANKNKEEKATVVENLDSHLTKAGERVANNKKVIFISVGVIAIAAAFVLSYLFIYRNPRLQNSWGSYNKVLLQQQKGEINDTTAAGEYQKVSTNFSGMPAGNVAALAAAQAYYNVGNYAAAIKLLEKLDLSEPVLQSRTTCLLGDCYVNTDKYSQELTAYDEAIQIADGNPELVPLYLVKKANVYSAQKKYNESLACYEQLKKDYPNYQFGNGLSIDYYIEREKALAGK